MSGTDLVNHPAHYTAGDIECIDAIRAALGDVGLVYYLRGSVMKYDWRLGLKDPPPQDAAKLRRYAEWIEDTLAGRPLRR